MDPNEYGVLAYYNPKSRDVLIEINTFASLDKEFYLELVAAYVYKMPESAYIEGPIPRLNELGTDILSRLDAEYPNSARIHGRRTIETALACLVGVEELKEYGRWLSKYVDLGKFYL